jgi:NAD(P)H-flavin reductase/ferredoxin
MSKLTIAEKTYDCHTGETVLDTLLREKVDISYICKVGSCQSCLLCSLNCLPPADSQVGLKETQKKQHYFLACRCYPTKDMIIKLPDYSVFYTEGTVVVHKLLNKNTLLLGIRFKDAFEFRAGQFVNLQRADGLIRSYSIANIPDKTHILEFHIKRLPKGRFSEWLHDEVKVGDQIMVSEPSGQCFYLPERSEQGLLLVGTGTGLAPLQGILMDALAHGHSGLIYLFHGCREVDDFYQVEEMRKLEKQHANFFYIPCLSGKAVVEGFVSGRVGEVIESVLADNLKQWRVFLCGNPSMIDQMKRRVFMKGVSSTDIYTDAFLVVPFSAE